MYANDAGIKKFNRLLQLRVSLEPRFNITGGELATAWSLFLGGLRIGFRDLGFSYQDSTAKLPPFAEDLDQRFEHPTSRQLLQAKLRVSRSGKHDLICRAPTWNHPLQERCDRWSTRVNSLQNLVPRSLQVIERQ